MARENLRYAASTVCALEEQHPEVFRDLVAKTGVILSEVADWEEAALLMYLPYDERPGIHPQDDSSSTRRYGISPTRRKTITLFFSITIP